MYNQIMEEMRTHIAGGTFAAFQKEFIANYVPSQKILAARGQTKVRGVDE